MPPTKWLYHEYQSFHVFSQFQQGSYLVRTDYNDDHTHALHSEFCSRCATSSFFLLLLPELNFYWLLLWRGLSRKLHLSIKQKIFCILLHSTVSHQWLGTPVL